MKFGVPGFDNLILKGEIRPGSVILLSGGCGTGKTIFGIQFLLTGVRLGEESLYISFEESAEKIRTHMKDSFNWDLESWEKTGKLKIIDAEAIKLARAVEAQLTGKRGELLIDISELPPIIPEGFHPKRVVIDSLSALASAFYGKEEHFRMYIHQLLKTLEERKAVVLALSETEQEPTKFSESGILEFLGDGVIALYNLRKEMGRVRAIEIIKMRGIKHVRKMVPMKITDSGIIVYPEEEML